MKKNNLIISFLIVVVLFLNPERSSSELDLDYTGYIYNLPSYMKMPEAADLFGLDFEEDYFFLDLTRFRFMPDLHITENSRITMHYELDMIWSKYSLPYLTGVDMTNRQALDLKWTLIDEEKFKAQHYIDMLYYKHLFDFGEITVGRQVISWGVGRIWQPMDLFNPINPANFSKFEKDGADAVSAKIYLGMFSDVEVVYNFREKWEDANFGGRYRTNFQMFDLALMAGYFDKRTILGASFEGDVLGAGIRGEGIFSYNENDTDSNFVRFILGADYQFTPDLYALIEYKFNGEGTDCKTCYDIGRLFRGEILNVSRNYLTGQANYKLHALVNLNAGGNINLNDESGYANLVIEWETLSNLKLSAAGIYFWGGRWSEYSYYSTTYYLMGQFYF